MAPVVKGAVAVHLRAGARVHAEHASATGATLDGGARKRIRERRRAEPRTREGGSPWNRDPTTPAFDRSGQIAKGKRLPRPAWLAKGTWVS